ncbi:hypothetical protein C9374_005518 [Naegleria lovaniensis]|uniref:Uncharacterized protein n=1 Tax=Naegleria lovaniensis TaxID=51637 RepID=A0AA88GN91_NAELO|nr:uncharacterized protein C9374_005518 [Naegleria lovaniensis]KAG2382316.1 hypothetical protein C9374_005518 [Naegleria lovaniensis]
MSKNNQSHDKKRKFDDHSDKQQKAPSILSNDTKHNPKEKEDVIERSERNEQFTKKQKNNELLVSQPSSSSSSTAASGNYNTTSLKGDEESNFKQLPREKLTMDDYYKKHQEFKLWLLNHKKKRVEDDLQNTEEIMKYFKKFIKKWNRGELSSKYYAPSGVHSSDLSHQQRTTYKWNFKNLSAEDEMKLELTRDKVDTNTFEKSWDTASASKSLFKSDESNEDNKPKRGTDKKKE